jgi:NADH dehydrogenase
VELDSMAKVITLFGGSGFIGRHLVRRLAKAGHTLRIAVRHPESAKFLRPLGEVGQITPIAADLTVPASLPPVLEGADQVVNLVAILHERGRQRFASLHVEGARRLAQAAKAAGLTDFLQVSALGAAPDAEADYAKSKFAGEQAVRDAFPDAIVVRPSIVVGPEDGFFNRFAAMAQISPVLPLIDGGRTLFQPTCVGDVAEAIDRLLADPGYRGRTFELAGPRTYSFRQLLELLLQEIGRKRLLLPLPGPLAWMKAAVFEAVLPKPPLTRDQIRLLRRNNVMDPGAAGYAALGMEPQTIEALLPTYLDRYRPGGRFAQAGRA